MRQRITVRRIAKQLSNRFIYPSHSGRFVDRSSQSRRKVARTGVASLAVLVLALVASGLFPATGLAQATADTGLGLASRKLVDGVLTVVPSDQNAEDTALGPFDLDFVSKHPELAWTAPDFPNNQPNFASPAETLIVQSKNVTLRHPVWGLEFAFKPMRLIEIDLPNATGAIEKKTVWYLVYRVRYTGNDLQPAIRDTADSEAVPGEPKRVQYDSVRFIPRFTMISK